MFVCIYFVIAAAVVILCSLAERTLSLFFLVSLSLVHSLSYALAIRIFYFAVARSIRHLLCLIRHSFAYTINNIAFLFSFSIDSQHSRAFVFDYLGV